MTTYPLSRMTTAFGCWLAMVIAMVIAPVDAEAQRVNRWRVVDSVGIRPIAVAAADSLNVALLERHVVRWDSTVFRVRVSADGGRNWNTLRTIPADTITFDDIAYPAAGHIVLAGRSPSALGAFLETSVNEGTTWRRTNLAAGGQFRDLRMLDRSDGVALFSATDYHSSLNDRVARTTDGGLTWTFTPIATGTPVTRQLIALDATNYVVRSGLSEARLFMHKTTDGGGSWTRAHPIPPGIKCFDFADPLHAFGVGAWYGDGIFTTTDGGMTWSDTCVRRRALWGLLVVDVVDRHGFVSGGSDRIYMTLDGGESWHEEYAPRFSDAPDQFVWDIVTLAPGRAVAALTDAIAIRSDEQELVRPDIVAPMTGSNPQERNIRYTWTPVEGADSYEFQIGDPSVASNATDAARFARPWFAATTSDTGVDVRLDSGTNYFARVRAHVGSELSGWSTLHVVRTWVLPVAMRSVTILRPTTYSVPTTVEVVWQREPSAIDYTVRLRNRWELPVIVADSGLTDTSYTFTDLVPGTEYVALVGARMPDGVTVGASSWFKVAGTVAGLSMMEHPTPTLVVRVDAVRGRGALEVEASNIAGGRLHFEIVTLLGERIGMPGVVEPAGGQSTFSLPVDLPPGSYFLRAWNDRSAAAARFVVIP